MKKLSKNISKKKKLKQQLIDKINSCKTLSELQGYKRTFSYHDVLKENYDWDYDFLLDIIKFKLIRMRDYFWTHNIVENEKEYGDICNKLVNILNAGYKTDIITEKDLGNIYVNDKNKYRFFDKNRLKFVNPNLRTYYLPIIRETKAKALFWKYLHHKIEYLWD